MASRLPRTSAQRIFDALPANFQRSVVGNVYQQVIQQLNDEGLARLEPLVAVLFPDVAPVQARRELSTRYINRPPTGADGRVLLQLRMSRANAQVATPGNLWFEAESSLSPADFMPENARYASDTFVDMQATRATGEEIGQSVPLRQALVENGFDDYAERRPLHGLELSHGLRRGTSEGHFEESNAHQTDGVATDHETPASSIGEKVNCLGAMLAWAAVAGKSKHRLLALLGDYGTGKTSHCFQFSRVLNGEVAHEAWIQPEQGAERLSALYIDLAELAGITTLAELSLAEILTVVLNKAAAGEGTVKEDDIQSLIQRARAGTLVMVFDGLDELLKSDRSVLHKVFDQLLKVLEPSKAQREKGQSSQARLIVSCRTHYFRDVEDQHGFFNTRQRGVAKAGDYLCLSLLPWTADNITSYLGKRLPEGQATELLNIIQTTYNLQELASRPVLLAMMSEQLGSLLRLRDAGEPITAARLYDITVSEWVQRDSGKHRLTAQHKAVLMGALAAAMWSEGVEAWSAEQLDRWLLRTVQKLFPNRYAVDQAEMIQDDLRTATFIVRPDAQRFSFAHRSFLEYFLARFIWDSLALCEIDALSDSDLHALLPTRALYKESQQFLKEICANQLRRLGTSEVRKRALPLLRALQTKPDAKSLLPDERANLWQLAIDFDITGEKTNVGFPESAPPLFDIATRDLPIDLSGLEFIGQQWQDKDFSWLPPLDLRGANLLKLRAHRCRFGKVLCDSQTNWGQALLRYCDTSGFQWGDSDRGGLIVRSGGTAERPSPVQRASGFALAGPWTLPIPRAAFTSVAFHPLGHQVLTGSNDGSATLWDCATGRELRRFEGSGCSVSSVAFHPQGHQVLTGSSDNTARLWDCATGKELRRFEGHGDSVSSVAFHPQGHQVLSGSVDKTARLWDCATGKELRRFEGHRGAVSSVAFHPQGHQLLTGSRDNTALLWDCATGNALRRFFRHDNWITRVAFHPQGHQVLTGSDDQTARLWDCATGKELRRFEGHGDGVTSLAFHPQGHQVLTGSRDKTARLWDCATSKELRRFDGHGSWVNSVAFHPQGHQVLTGSDDGSARLWDCARSKELRRFEGSGYSVSSVAFHPQGHHVLTGGDDQTARLWDSATSQELRRFEGHGNSVVSVAFHPQGHQVLTGSDDQTARLWDCATGKELRRFEGHRGAVSSVAFHPQGHQVLTGSHDHTARLWDCATGNALRRFDGHDDSVSSVAFHPQGHQVLTGSHDHTARLWDCATRKELRRFEGHGDRVTSLAFRPQGHHVLTGSHDHTARLWDCATGKELRRFEGHGDSVVSVAFHPQGHHVLTGSHDHTARLWDCATGKELRRFEGHGDSVVSVAFHPQGHQVLTGSYDKTARLWFGVDLPKARYTACRLFMHGIQGPSTAMFDAKGNLLDWDDEAIDTWLFTLANGVPEPLEMAPQLSE